MSRPPTGRFLGIPYNWTRVRRGDLRRSVWDPDEPRVFQPKTLGWGYDINGHALVRKLRRRRS